MSNVAFICPIYDSRDHFLYGQKLYKSKIDNNIKADLYFIFSNDEQKDKFRSLVETIGIVSEFKYLILPQNETNYKSQVTIKKFFGLKVLKDKYKYIATIDSEAIFIKSVDFETIFESMWENREMLKANKSPNGFFIMRNCFMTLGIYDNRTLRKETNNYLYNIWFNDIPIYKCDVLNDFFYWLNDLGDGYKNEWECFEYYIFMAFLVIEKGYKIQKFDFESLGGIMEYLYLFPQKKQFEIIQTLNSHWTSSDNCVSEQSCIRFHLDRDENDSVYGSNEFKRIILEDKIRRLRVLVRDYLRGDLC